MHGVTEVNLSLKLFQNQESHQYHNPYDQELREYQALENGDWEQLKKSLDEKHDGTLGRLAQNDIRHLKNMGIVVVTLSCRAAIRGGMLPEAAFTLSDAYIQKLEELKDAIKIEGLTYYCKYHYCQLVANEKNEQRQKRNDPHPKINQCKNYIFSHLHGKISVSEIAAYLGFSSQSHLGAQFKKVTGYTLRQYRVKFQNVLMEG